MKTKKDPRHQARRIATQSIFEWSFYSNVPLSESSERILLNREALSDHSDLKILPIDEELYQEIITGVANHREVIDRIITDCAPEWPIDQISRVDLSILRISIYELLHRESTPIKVAIDEAVELAKEFGGNNSSKFINGVLGTVVKQIEEGTLKRATPQHEHQTT